MVRIYDSHLRDEEVREVNDFARDLMDYSEQQGWDWPHICMTQSPPLVLGAQALALHRSLPGPSSLFLALPHVFLEPPFFSPPGTPDLQSD